jgi:hypothetical protein
VFETHPHKGSSQHWRDRNPEDVDTTAEDHAYDPLRYSQTNIGAVQTPPPPNSREYRHPAEQIRGI